MNPTREFIQYSSSWNIPSAYENFTHRGSNFSSTFSSLQQYKLHRAFQPPFSLAIGRAQSPAERGKSLAFFVYRAAQIIFLRQFRYSRNAIRSISVANAFANASKKKKYIFFPFPDVESWITKRYISIFLKRGTVSSREYGTLCDTSVLRNVARWVSMSCHANDTCILQRRCHIRDDARMIPRILSWVVTIFFNFKKLLRWLIIKEVFLFWLINIFARMNIYIYTVYF